MPIGARARLLAAACVGVAAGVTAWARVAPLEPLLDVTARRTADPLVWTVELTARGDEPVLAISAAPAVGPVRDIEPAAVAQLEPGRSATLRVRLDPGGVGARSAVRLTWTPGRGSSPRTSDHPLLEQP